MKKINYQFSLCFLLLITSSCQKDKDIQLFDGHTLNGWEGSSTAFRVAENAIIGGDIEQGLDKSAYLCTTREYSDFELTLSVKLVHTDLKGNAGISFRAQRVKDSHRVASYQADIGYISPEIVARTSDFPAIDMKNQFSLWGCLIDENRADLSRYPDPDWYPGVALKYSDRELIHSIVKPYDWNEMKVIAHGNKIEIEVNGVSTIQYTEQGDIADSGLICLQAHSGAPYEVHYKDIQIREIE